MAKSFYRLGLKVQILDMRLCFSLCPSVPSFLHSSLLRSLPVLSPTLHCPLLSLSVSGNFKNIIPWLECGFLPVAMRVNSKQNFFLFSTPTTFLISVDENYIFSRFFIKGSTLLFILSMKCITAIKGTLFLINKNF